MILVLSLSVTAMAAGPGPNAQNATPGSGQGDGLYGEFVDDDGDGVCDNYADRDPAQDGTGKQWGAGPGNQAGQCGEGANFVDEDGDGLCDLMRQGNMGKGQGRFGQGRHMQDGSQMQRQGGRWNR